jgi:PAS domain S-box-containing protein
MASSKGAALCQVSLEHQRDVILNSAGEGIYHLDLDGSFVFVNPKGAELVGCEANDLIGKPAHPTIHHKHADGREYSESDCPILASLRDGNVRRITNDVFWRKDGTAVHVDYVAAPVKNTVGKISGTIVTFRDSTHDRLSEARIKLQAEQYRLLFETNPSPMWVFDVKTLRILAVNEAAINHYGYSREEFLALTIADLRATEDVAGLITALGGKDAPAHHSGEFRHRRNDGSFILAQIYSAPIVWEGITSRIVTAIDITERKRIEEELRASQAQLRTVFENLGEGVVVSDLDGNLTHWNRASLELHGIREQDQRNLTALVDTFALREIDGTPIAVENWPLARILRGETIRELELRVRNLKTNVERIFSYGGTVVRDATDSPLMAIVTIRDVTARKEAETRLRENASFRDSPDKLSV